ncbi:MAG: hypothetical protein R2729_05465 [Bryobacteraceae bacterium]
MQRRNPLDPARNPLVRVIVRGAAETARERSLQAGFDEGIRLGRVNGKIPIIRRLIADRFSSVPPWAALRLRRANGAQLDRWGKAILEAETLEAALEVPARTT